MKQNVIIVGLGHTARNGKDSVANFLKEMHPNTHIIHWADKLYEECRNTNSEIPLIRQVVSNGSYFYQLLDQKHEWGGVKCTIKSAKDVPMLHKMFLNRNIQILHGMKEKDAELLQFWGTDFRRNQDDLYWIKRTVTDINKLIDSINTDEPALILIPDTRFINEYNCLKHDLYGTYVKVTRLNDDGSKYIAPDRNPNHPSESNLKDIPGDIELTAYSGDMDSLKILSRALLNGLLSKYQLSKAS